MATVSGEIRVAILEDDARLRRAFLEAVTTASDCLPVAACGTAAEAAEYLQLSEAEVMELIQSGALKARKIGTRYLVAKTRLDEWMNARAKRR